MKICIFTNHFYPEDFKVNDIAFELAKRGYDVTVVTAVPDYPQGRFYEGYSLFKRKKEVVDGVLVYRLPVIPRGKGGKIRLALNYVSYFVSALLFTVFSLYRKDFDAVFVHLTSPFFIGLPAALLKRKKKIPLIFWTLDLWPESLMAAGNIKNKVILNTQIKLVRYVYDNCDKILIGSQGFKKTIREIGGYDEKLIYFPNWAEEVAPVKDASLLLQSKPFSDFTADDFIILFAGNLGAAQNLDCVLNASADLELKSRPIKIVLMGDGRQREHLINRAADLKLSDSVFFPGRYPLDSMPVFMNRADILLLSLKDDSVFNLTVPSKLQFYMAQGKPVLALLNGDGAELVKESRCGIAVPANDAAGLRDAVNRLYNMPKDELTAMGDNGKRYYEEHFSKSRRMEQICGYF